MLDTDDVSKLIGAVPLLATYADLVDNAADLRRKFPASQVLLIDRGSGDPAGEATIADVERGLLTPGDVRPWIERKEREGRRDLMVYANRNTWPQIDADTQGLRFARWYATLDGTAHIDGYAPLVAPAAIQVIGADALGYHADLSLVFDSLWNPAPEPDWALRARNLAQAVLGEIQHTDGNVGTLARLLSEKH